MPRAVEAVRELAAASGGRLHVVQADARAADLTALAPEPRQIVANFPYNVGTPLLIGWLRQAAAFERMTLMFQQEVAERIAAEVGTAAYGRLAVLAQWTCDRVAANAHPAGRFRAAAAGLVRRRLPRAACRASRRPRCSRPWSG